MTELVRWYVTSYVVTASGMWDETGTIEVEDVAAAMVQAELAAGTHAAAVVYRETKSTTGIRRIVAIRTFRRDEA